MDTKNKYKQEEEARLSDTCYGCGEPKEDDKIVCWGCFKYRKIPYKTFSGTIDEWLLKLGKEKPTTELLKKHKGHTIEIFERTSWQVSLDEKGEIDSKATDEVDGFEDTAHCFDCNEDITDNDFVSLVIKAIDNNF
jgi:hypothetical protein